MGFAKASEDSRAIMQFRQVQRAKLKNAMLQEEQRSFEKLSASFRERNKRSLQKTQGSPFAADLLAESWGVERRTQDMYRSEARRRELARLAAQHAHEASFSEKVA